jgi:hypothetical protein
VAAPQASLLTAEIAEEARRSQRARALCVLCAFSATSEIEDGACGALAFAGKPATIRPPLITVINGWNGGERRRRSAL